MSGYEAQIRTTLQTAYPNSEFISEKNIEHLFEETTKSYFFYKQHIKEIIYEDNPETSTITNPFFFRWPFSRKKTKLSPKRIIKKEIPIADIDYKFGNINAFDHRFLRACNSVLKSIALTEKQHRSICICPTSMWTIIYHYDLEKYPSSNGD